MLPSKCLENRKCSIASNLYYKRSFFYYDLFVVFQICSGRFSDYGRRLWNIISVNNIVATDGSNESNLGSATYSTTIAAPLSGNANLSALSVNGATLTPAFAPGTTSYDIGEVDFSVSKLDINYTAEDGSTSEYKVTVVVMPKYDGKVPVIEGAEEKETEPETEELTTEEETTVEETTDISGMDEGDKDSGGVSVVVLILVGVIALGAGFGGCFVLVKKGVLGR